VAKKNADEEGKWLIQKAREENHMLLLQKNL